MTRKLTKELARALLLATVIGVLGVGGAWAAPTTANAQQEQMQEFLKGAKLWGTYCRQCHKARPPAEFSPAQWDTIMMHMRSRANLTGEDAKDILEFLKRR
jgi:cytochrome c5